MPGVQILFGFLLAVPFQQRFERCRRFQRTSTSSRCSAAAGAGAPDRPDARFTACCSARARSRDDRVWERAGRSCGLVLLALAMIGAVLLLTDVIFGAAASSPWSRRVGGAVRLAVVRDRLVRRRGSA